MITALRTHHQQVRITHGDCSADVDEKIAPLVLELWRAGIETMMSCERHTSGKVWIGFATAVDAENFLNIVCDGDAKHRRWARVESWYFGQYEPRSGPLHGTLSAPMNPADWEFHVTINDDSFANTGQPGKHPAFRLEIAVLFPQRDLKVALDKMREHNTAAVEP